MKIAQIIILVFSIFGGEGGVWEQGWARHPHPGRQPDHGAGGAEQVQPHVSGQLWVLPIILMFLMFLMFVMFLEFLMFLNCPANHPVPRDSAKMTSSSLANVWNSIKLTPMI